MRGALAPASGRCPAPAARVPDPRVPRTNAVATYARERDNSNLHTLGGSPHQPDFGARHRSYRCSLPGLTGFTTSRREGADTDCHGKEVADRQGFEPWNTFWMLLAFQASAFDRSAICPLPAQPRSQGLQGVRMIAMS